MRAVIQRVTSASCRVDGNVTGEIEKGFLVFLGITHSDNEKVADYLVNKLINLRVFEDENEKILEANEIDHLVDGLVNLLGQDASVSSINIDDIKASDIRNAKVNIQNSKILNATITVDDIADIEIQPKMEGKSIYMQLTPKK